MPDIRIRFLAGICFQLFATNWSMAYAEPEQAEISVVGSWEVVSETYDGQLRESHDVFEFSPKGILSVFTARTKETVPSPYFLDPTKSPARIEWRGEELKLVGICKMEGGNLIVCGRVVALNSTDKGPKEFSSNKSSEHFLIRFSRRE